MYDSAIYLKKMHDFSASKNAITHPAFAFSNTTMETLEQCVKSWHAHSSI